MQHSQQTLNRSSKTGIHRTRFFRWIPILASFFLLYAYTQMGCQAGYPCTTHTDCPKGKICTDGLCSSCTTDQDCGDKQRCIVGFCQTKRGPKERIQSEKKQPDAGTPTERKTSTEDDPIRDTDPVNDTIQKPDTPQEPDKKKPNCVAGETRSCYGGDLSTSGIGVCKTGVQTCQSDETWSTCVGAVMPSKEQCGDGKDNDCDGKTDEADAGCQCTPGQNKPCGSPVGECKVGKIACKTNGEWGECVGETAAQKEICDGKDNDCDGKTDENFAQVGKACYVGTGTCKATGTYVCDNTGLQVVCNAKEGKPSTEVCDGKDNDCNGKTDENLTQNCYTGTKGTEGVGICKGGTQVCKAGKWESCRNEVKPASKEACNGLDDNCDGKVDEGCTCRSGQTQSCGTNTGLCTKGQQTCVAGKWGQCSGGTSAQPEKCDGKDNDCDGKVDENWNVGGTCYAGTGSCRTKGTYLCNASKTSITCSAKPGKASTEVCDGKDNDCDGRIDESLSRSCYTGPSGTLGKGLCAKGTQTCSSGIWGSCKSQTLPKPELCDGRDNDCDGSVDETFSSKGKSCSSGLGACRRTGSYVCNSSRTGLICSATPGKSTAEICDGKDNDCDGQTDENWSVGKTCSVGVGSCRRSGTYVCNTAKTGIRCNAIAGKPNLEICDGKDNDCDGKVDESLTRSCYTGPSNTAGKGLCKKGVQTCSAGKWNSTCTGQVLPALEKCDKKDNDCDGSIDEGTFGTCNAGRGCIGRKVCNNGALICFPTGSCCGTNGKICP